MDQDVEKMIAEQRSRTQERLTKANAALFACLAEDHSRIAVITVDYAGHFDSGWINEIRCYDAEGQPVRAVCIHL